MDDKTLNHQYSEALIEAAFAKLGYFVYTNNSGKASSDLIVEDEEGYLLRVEVKSSGSIKENTIGKYIDIQLKSVRSNTSVNTIKRFNPDNSDILAIVCVATSQIKLLHSCNIDNTSSMRVYLNSMHFVHTIEKVE